MHAQLEHVGKRVKCPDCGTITLVPRPPEKKASFRAPDANDVLIEAAPPPLVDEKRKEIADRLMAQATDEVEVKERERPQPPQNPLRDGIYSFPFYSNVVPLWVGTAIALLVDAAIFDALIDVIKAGGYASIMAAFFAPILAIVTLSIIGMVAPHFLTIIEYTAEGYDKVPYWPSQDLLSRGRAMLFGINALAMSTMPGMLLVGLLRPLGIPLQLGLISTVLLLPLVVLSMADNDSVFAPFSKFVFGSVQRHYNNWTKFYLHVILLAIGIVAIDYLVWTAGPGRGISASMTDTGSLHAHVSRAITFVSVCVYAVIYCRLIGRLGWILGQEELVVESDRATPEEEL
jgi:hypothetical protein